MKKRVDQEPGYVLHTYPYKETSLIVEAFTRRHGRVALLARGARRPRSAMRGVLLAFYPLRMGWSGSAELATLVSAEWAGGLPPLAGRGLMCGFYLNELILRLLPREDPHEALFDAYGEALARLAAAERVPALLRSFEKRLLAELGYAPMFDRDAQSGAPIESHGDLVISGRTLLDLAADDYSRSETRDEARYLMRALIGQRLHGQVLHTRSVLMELNEL
ncbi:MAG: DNA repair protein RecO [Betaproteobacteria bacterium]|nr:DNA repair protein RecO [Betaproteobacteria bacterium]